MTVPDGVPSLKKNRIPMLILRYTPEVFMAAPERVFLKFAGVCIGVGLLLTINDPNSTLAEFPDWAIAELGLTFILGGVAALVGIVRKSRSLEQFGLAATAFASIMYAFGLVVLYGTTRYPSVVIFLGLAAASVTRLIVSSAAVKVVEAAHHYDYAADHLDTL